MTDEKKPSFKGFNPNRLTCGVSAVNLIRCELSRGEIDFISILTPMSIRHVQVRPFRARKKTSISSEPAPPMADKCKGIERIKTDYNSYLYTWHSLVNQQPMRNRAISTGYGFV